MSDIVEKIEKLANAIGCACEMEGMKALNKHRESAGASFAYDEIAFYDVMDKWNVKPPQESAEVEG